jgi:hypothetical protein
MLLGYDPADVDVHLYEMVHFLVCLWRSFCGNKIQLNGC